MFTAIKVALDDTNNKTDKTFSFLIKTFFTFCIQILNGVYIVVLGDKAAFQPAKIRWTSEKKVVGVEGEPVKFMCIFSG